MLSVVVSTTVAELSFKSEVITASFVPVTAIVDSSKCVCQNLTSAVPLDVVPVIETTELAILAVNSIVFVVSVNTLPSDDRNTFVPSDRTVKVSICVLPSEPTAEI